MTRSELLEKIKTEIPNNLIEEEIAAYIMKEIAMDRAFSEHYYWGDAKTAKRIYEESKDERNTEIQDKRKIICVTLSKLFKFIGEEMGLDVYYVDEFGIVTKNVIKNLTMGEHVYPAIKLKDGRLIKCDIQRDITNIQTGFRWKCFGTRSFGEKFLSKFSEKEIDKIMRKIGVISDEKGYTEDYCREQKLQIKSNASVAEIVENVFTDDRLNSEIKKTSVRETFRFYGKVFNIYITKDRMQKWMEPTAFLQSFKKKLFMFPCVILKNGISRYTICTYIFENKQVEKIYLLSRTDKMMLPITVEELKYFISQGLQIGVQGNGTKHFTRKLEETSKTVMPKVKLDNLLDGID